MWQLQLIKNDADGNSIAVTPFLHSAEVARSSVKDFVKENYSVDLGDLNLFPEWEHWWKECKTTVLRPQGKLEPVRHCQFFQSQHLVSSGSAQGIQTSNPTHLKVTTP